MKKLLALLLLSPLMANAYALPDCPSDISKLWDKCFGTINLNNGDKYVGEWKDDKKNGQGAYTFGNQSQWAGDKYVGEFIDDKKYGQGTYTFASGDKYVGKWKDDKKHGQGTFTYADGDKYVGEFKDGNYHGQGTYTYSNQSQWAGDKYVGEFKDDMRHGQGTYTFANGEQQAGYFLKNVYIPSTCKDMGLVKGSSEFGQCVITLINKL